MNDDDSKRQKETESLLKPFSTIRLEAFSDGVFAIAITLLVLEIKLPHLSESGEHLSLANALFSQWASYLAYIVSFVMIGIYWVNHHYVFRFYRGTNHVFNLLNVFFLMCISFLPFPTAVISEYIEVAGEERVAVMFYAFGLLLPAIGWGLMWFYASRNYRLIDRRLDQNFVRYLTRQYVVSILIYLFAVLISWWSWKIGLGVCLGLTLLYLMPSKEPVLRRETD